MLTELDASAVRRWCSALAAALAAHQTEIDELNVYPVPDGDTGTNMALTAKAAAETLTGADAAGASEVLQAMARGAVLGARGNSGVILSQILRGMAEASTGVAQLSAEDLGRALQAAAKRAYECVGEPVEGTILSVAKAVADAAPTATTAGLAEVARTAVSAARQALDRTPSQLAELARAGVVDAGGRGLVVVLEALSEVVTGDVAELDNPTGGHRRAARPRPPREVGSGDFEYEVQYLLDAPPAAMAGLREALQALGDSVAVVGRPRTSGTCTSTSTTWARPSRRACVSAGRTASRCPDSPIRLPRQDQNRPGPEWRWWRSPRATGFLTCSPGKASTSSKAAPRQTRPPPRSWPWCATAEPPPSCCSPTPRR